MFKLFGRKKESIDPEQFLQTEHLKKDLKGRSVRGGAVTLASQGAKFFLQMGSTSVLARLLSPADYGLIGMAAVLIGFIELFKYLGLSKATVQRAEVNHKQVSTLFWINVALGLLLTAIVACSAPIVSWFFKTPELLSIVLALSITFFVSSLNVQHRALLLRQMRYVNLAQIDIATMIISLIAAVLAGIRGWGYWALVVMQLTKALADLVLVWSTCRWRPGKPDWQSGIKPFIIFGRNLTAFNVVNYFSRNFDNLLIGRVWGSVELGLYTKAYQLVLFPVQQINSPITSVALPSLSRLQDDPEQYRAYYYKAITLITSIGMPVIAFMFAAADKVILLLLGEQWLEVVTIFRWLMPAAFMATFNAATGWVYQSLSQTDRQFKWGMLSSLSNVVLFAIFIRWGALGIAAAFSSTRIILIIPALKYCYKNTPLTVVGLLSAIYPPTISSIGAAAMVIGINHFIITWSNTLSVLLLDMSLYTVSYLLIWITIPNGKIKLLEMTNSLKLLKKKSS